MGAHELSRSTSDMSDDDWQQFWALQERADWWPWRNGQTAVWCIFAAFFLGAVIGMLIMTEGVR